MEKGCGYIFTDVFDKILDILLAPYGAFFAILNKSVCGLHYPPNVDTTVTKSDIVNGFNSEIFGAS